MKIIATSRSRYLDLDGDVETKSRFLDLDRDISIVETNFLKLSRFSQPSRLILFWRRDRDLDRDHVETNRDPQPYKNDKHLNSSNNLEQVPLKVESRKFFCSFTFGDTFTTNTILFFKYSKDSQI